MKYCLLQKNKPRAERIGKITRYLATLDMDTAWRVEVKEVKATRSLAQNAYIWGVCYPTILEQGGEALRGWTADDIHEYMLGEWSGWETLNGFGKRRLRPLRRSSRLSVSEFNEYVDFIHRTAANLSIVIPDPDPELRAA